MSEKTLNDFGKTKFDPLKIKTKQIEEVDFCILMFLEGYIDTQSISNFQEEIDLALSSGYINFIFDCEDLAHISSSNLGLFTDLLEKIKPFGGEIVFYGLQGKVLEVFSLLGFYDYFVVTTDIYEAIDHLIYFEEDSEKEKKEIFPCRFHCPICNVKLKAEKKGTFRCSSCKIVLNVSEKGNITLG